MEFVIIESSKLLCIQHIIQHIRKYILYQINTSCTLQIMKKCNSIILCSLLPRVLENIIIEYANEIYDVSIELWATHLTHDSLYNCAIVVKNDILKINHTYHITIEPYRRCINFYGLNIKYILNIEELINVYTPDAHHCFINHYMKHYNPKKEQLIFENCVNHHNHNKNYIRRTNEIISNINNHEQFGIELMVVIALLNGLYHVVV